MRYLLFASGPIVLAEEPLDFRYYGSGLTRLGEISVATDFHCLLAVGGEGVRGECDDGDFLRRGIVLQNLSGFPAVDDRNGDVHQDQVGLLGARLGDSL